MTLVRIVWRDTHAEDGWVVPGECNQHPRTIISVGWLLNAEKSGHHTIAQDWDADAGRYGGVSHIVSSCVEHVEVLDE
jgi:hypothetical protein